MVEQDLHKMADLKAQLVHRNLRALFDIIVNHVQTDLVMDWTAPGPRYLDRCFCLLGEVDKGKQVNS